MNPDDYKRDPCGASSLPFWKTNSISIPPSMMIVRDDRFTDSTDSCCDTPYFKLVHQLHGVTSFMLPPGFSLVSADESSYAAHISRCYEKERVSADELTRYKDRPVYDPDLWIALKDNHIGEIAATGIAELDQSIREGVLEWIQVSPEYRRRGLGRFLVNELLFRMKGKADFVTVSGRMDHQTNPFALYRSCGFQDPVIWHVIQNH